MTMLTIHSRLKSYQLLDRLFKLKPTSIGASGCFDRTPSSFLLEAMGQLAALHVRHLVNFERHAFLLKVTRFEVPALEHTTGCFNLTAELLNQSSNAFAYRIEAQGAGHERLVAELLIGTQAYDTQFQEANLQAHYQNRFNRMLTDDYHSPGTGDDDVC